MFLVQFDLYVKMVCFFSTDFLSATLTENIVVRMRLLFILTQDFIVTL